MDPVYSFVLPCGADTTAPEKYWKVSETFPMVDVRNSKRSGRSWPRKGGRLFVRRISDVVTSTQADVFYAKALSRVAWECCYVSIEVWRLFWALPKEIILGKWFGLNEITIVSVFICSRSYENSICFIIKNNTYNFGRCLWAIPAQVWPLRVLPMLFKVYR